MATKKVIYVNQNKLIDQMNDVAVAQAEANKKNAEAEAIREQTRQSRIKERWLI